MRRLTTEEWIEKAIKVHGNKYDYSKVNYITNNTKVIVICPIHGEIEQVPRSHLATVGCQKCANKTKLAKEEFIERAIKVHGDVYDYTKTVYKNTYSKVLITCPIHGDWAQLPMGHLQSRGCPKCAIESRVAKNSKTTEQFIEEAKKVHNSKYNYTKVEYVNHKEKVIIICPEHGEFMQSPNSHLIGKGCPSCAVTGFDKTKPGLLYYLKVTLEDGKELYKIGITNRSVNRRFNPTELKKIKVIKVEEFKSGKDAWDKERGILSKYKEYKYIGPDVLDSGNTELFTENVMALKLN